MAVASLRHRHPKGKSKMTYFRVICKSVLNHPFLIVMLMFLICLHQYFPFLFFLLVSASPVIICAAILLGTLLIYGQPNDKYREETRDTTVALKTGVEDHTYSSEREGLFSKDIFAEVRNDIVEKDFRALGMLNSEISVNDDLTKEVDREYCSGELSTASTICLAQSKNGFGFANFDKTDVPMHRHREYDYSIKGHHDHVMQEKHPDDTGNHESSDCESDGADKSSFDALVAGVVPTFHEARPFLDFRDPVNSDASHDSSHKFELQCVVSSQSCEGSSDDGVVENETLEVKDDEVRLGNAWMEMEKSQHLESLITRTVDERDEEEVEDDESTEDVEVDDDEYDDDDEENTKVEKDESAQVTMWTEEDEKNLRLVGNSELERDLRLENLLARRRAKRNFSMISERNLIDLDRPETSFHIPPITTTRVNPFDAPVNTNQQFSIPPIPGSAPSVSVPRKNPFESPSTSPIGVENLTEDLLKEEPVEMNLNNAVFHEIGSSSTTYNPMGNVLTPDFVDFHRKDAVFRRYDSFSAAYNFTEDASRQDFLETDRRNAAFRRHETFNTRSAFRNFVDSPETLAFLKMKPVFVPEHIGDQEVRHPSSGRESSHDSESSMSSSEDDHTETPNSLAKHEFIGPNEDLITESDHASSRSDDTSSESSDRVDTLHDHPEEEFVGSAEVNADNMYEKAEAAHEIEDDASSSTSMTSSEDHSSEKMGQDEDETVNEAEFSPIASSRMSDANPVSMEEDHGIIEPPVYDSSPSSSVDKITIFSSTDAHV